MYIYPTKKELAETTELYLVRYHNDWYSQFSKTRWVSYFEDNIYQNVIFHKFSQIFANFVFVISLINNVYILHKFFLAIKTT